MSYDSLHALREARTAVQGGPYPPFVSYVWRVVDALWPGPTLMLAVQNFLLIAAVGSLCRSFGYRTFGTLVGMTFFVTMPAILGPMLVVWKDVAVSACFSAACALLGVAQRATTAKGRRAALSAAVAAIFGGMAYRFNAVAGALPLLIWWVAVMRHQATPVRRAFVVWTTGGAALTAVLFAGVTLINSYALPGLRPLVPNPSFNAVRVYDLLGMSAIERRSVVPSTVLPGDPDLLGEYAARIYSPAHVNRAMDADRDGVYRSLLSGDPKLISIAWREAVASHPRAYLTHRWLGFEVLIGLHSGEVFYPTHPGVDPNEFGIVHVPSRVTAHLLDYMRESCQEISCTTFLCRPWVWYLAGGVATLFCVLLGSEPVRRATMAIFMSGAAYLAPQFFIDPAADLRYNHWAIVAMAICCLAAVRLVVGRVRPGRLYVDLRTTAPATLNDPAQMKSQLATRQE